MTTGGERRPRWKRMVGRVFKRILAWRYRNFRPGAQPSHWVRVSGMKLWVSQGVFDPRVHFTSGFFARYLGKPGVVLPGWSVLEVGTGTGVLAISVARAGAAHVVAIDVNPAAIQCATLNVKRFGLQEQISVRHGDMFAPVPGEQFDLILCNPPYFRGVPHNDAERAYLGGSDFEWLDRFAEEARTHLRAGGRCLIVLGDAADIPAILARFRKSGWLVETEARKDILVEVLYIFALRLPALAE